MTIQPVEVLRGALALPGDKSISHRYALLAAIAEGTSTLRNYSDGADCQSTLRCIKALGAGLERTDEAVVIHGRGRHGLQASAEDLDAGNSGSTIRMLSGILAGQPFTSRLVGDESLSRRPMERIMKPLAEMGVHVAARDGRFPPLTVTGNPELRAIDYTLPVASAQVKSCVLFAGLHAEGETVVREAVRTRDHTELALREFGADIEVQRGVIRLHGRPTLHGRELQVPGDLSSAAFFLVAALLRPGSRLSLQGVGLNPTRAGLIDFLVGMGATVKVPQLAQAGGELVGNLQVESSPIRGGTIAGALTAALIDEVPVLAVLGAASRDGLTVKDAGELRVKETDRIASLAENFGRMGVQIDVAPDGFHVPGGQRFRAAQLDSFGDHRIAMAFAVAALAADGPCEISHAEAASVSYPGFYDALAHLR